MQALVFTAAGEPSQVLAATEHPTPTAGPGEALIAVSARPIHPADLAFIRGRYRIQPRFPQAAGLEGAGRILECPPGSGFVPGQRVAFRAPGSWADCAVAPLDRLLAIPDDIDDAAACQMSLNPLTAFCLLRLADLRQGDWLVLTAATSTVANLIAGIARARGVRTIGVVRGAVATPPRTSTDAVFAADDPDLAGKILEATGPAKAAALMDSVGGPLVTSLMPTLAPGARVLAYGVQDPAPAAITNAMLIYANLTWIGFGIDRALGALSAKQHAGIVQDLWTMTRTGALALPVAARFGLPQFQEALAADARPGRVGKVLLI
jgi:NADPH2:quinone reductase